MGCTGRPAPCCPTSVSGQAERREHGTRREVSQADGATASRRVWRGSVVGSARPSRDCDPRGRHCAAGHRCATCPSPRCTGPPHPFRCRSSTTRTPPRPRPRPTLHRARRDAPSLRSHPTDAGARVGSGQPRPSLGHRAAGARWGAGPFASSRLCARLEQRPDGLPHIAPNVGRGGVPCGGPGLP